jgi:hypothetical protein
MGWEKGKPRRPVVAPLPPEPKTEPEESGGVKAVRDTTIYNNEHEPLSVKSGEIIPEGWTTEPRTLRVRWKNKIDGSWYSEPVEA